MTIVNEAIDEAIEVLNRIHAADPSVLPTLIAHRVPCNKQVADDLTVQVGCRPGSDECEVGFLGVINGLFGCNENSIGFICAKYDDQRRLTGFGRT